MTQVQSQKTIFGHPAGLYVLFFTEMWERFSYYGMRALLVLYMTKYLFINPELGKEILGFEAIRAGLEAVFGELTAQALASQIYGLYTGLVYMTPFFGGVFADKVLGQRKSVYLGGFLMAIGHFMMAFETWFFPALLFLILGNGCFKPNISTQVGALYAQGDSRRDSAFTIFYMGINLGAFFSPLVCGTLGETVGWHYGFGAAGIGMLIGLLVYHFGRKLLPGDLVSDKKRDESAETPLTANEKKRIWTLIALCVLNIFFWGVFEQQGNTLQLWATDNTNWSFLGFEIPSTWYQSFNPAMIFMFAPLLDMLWRWQNKRGSEPETVTKMGIGCILAGAGFIFMILAAKVVAPTEKGSIFWLTSTTWLFTMGELFISPIGLSLVTKLAPLRLQSRMMGMWFLSSFFGNYAAGFIGSFYEKMSKDSFFLLCTCLGIFAGLAFIATKKPLGKIIKEAEGK